MKISLKKKLAIAATAATIASGAGIAVAYWTTTGSGSGSAATTDGVVDTLSFTTSTINAMYPGDDAQDVTVTVENTDPNESVYVSSVKAYLTVVGSGACDSTDFLLNNSAAPGTAATAVALDWTATELDAGESVDTAVDTIQFHNKATNQDGCKDAAVTLHYLAG